MMNTRRRTRRMLLSGILLAGGIALVTTACRRRQALPNDVTALKELEEERTVGVLTFSANNKYTRLHGPIGGHYPWIDAPVVEPFRESTLIVKGGRNNHKYFWNISSSRGNQTITFEGLILETNFTEIDDYTVGISEYHRHKLKREYYGKLIIRYVRRELRSLEPIDRERFMSTAFELWSLSSDEGVAIYGNKFRSIDYLTALHNHLAGDRECDHMHDGLGFMTQHAGLTYLFEKALQSVDQSVTVPYWDWTIDVTRDAYNNLSNAAIWSWEVWNPEYFGSASNSEHTMTEGRWAFVNVSKDNWNETHNPYGFLRAPWNMNSRPYLTRYNYTGSAKHQFATVDMGLPTCMDFWNLLMDYDTWYEFGWAMPYDPHARVHSVIGGSEAGPKFDKIAKYFNDSVLSEIAKLHFFWTKNMWRSYMIDFPSYCSLDTPQHHCRGSCDQLAEAIEEENLHIYIDMFGDSSVISAIMSLTQEKQAEVVKSMCDSALAIGDQMESASPLDISFWPIHPNLERIWMVKKLSGTFTSEEWPINGTSLGSECYGHGPKDVLPFGDIFDSPGHRHYQNLTNVELYAMMDPNNDQLPYLYDDFTLLHCEYYGFDFESWMEIPTRSRPKF